jgi:hypothetical protein
MRLVSAAKSAEAPVHQAIEQKLPQYIMDPFKPGPLIQLSSLREDVVPVGSLQLAVGS